MATKTRTVYLCDRCGHEQVRSKEPLRFGRVYLEHSGLKGRGKKKDEDRLEPVEGEFKVLDVCEPCFCEYLKMWGNYCG